MKINTNPVIALSFWISMETMIYLDKYGNYDISQIISLNEAASKWRPVTE
jgi:hypothetical protein